MAKAASALANAPPDIRIFGKLCGIFIFVLPSPNDIGGILSNDRE
jgi:hypothetical protein